MLQSVLEESAVNPEVLVGWKVRTCSREEVPGEIIAVKARKGQATQHVIRYEDGLEEALVLDRKKKIGKKKVAFTLVEGPGGESAGGLTAAGLSIETGVGGDDDAGGRGGQAAGEGAAAFHSPESEDQLAAAVGAVQARLAKWNRTGICAYEPAARLHFPGALVVSAVRARKYDAEAAFEQLRRYRAFHKAHGWSPAMAPAPYLPELLSGAHQLLPGCDLHGRSVVLFSPGRLALDRGDPRAMERQQMAAYWVCRHAVLRQRPAAESTRTQLRGVVLVCDFAGLALATVTQASRADAQRGVGVVQDCFPLRLGAVLIVNNPPFFSAAVALVSPFLRSQAKVGQG
jgi:hypothetical protein